eukprot:6191574-Pleurochrysis_carterae.AAC.1
MGTCAQKSHESTHTLAVLKFFDLSPSQIWASPQMCSANSTISYLHYRQRQRFFRPTSAFRTKNTLFFFDQGLFALLIKRSDPRSPSLPLLSQRTINTT